MNLWMVKYRTESGCVKVARVLAGQRVDAWVTCVRHEYAVSQDMPVELVKIRMDGTPNLAKGARIFEPIPTGSEEREVRYENAL